MIRDLVKTGRKGLLEGRSETRAEKVEERLKPLVVALWARKLKAADKTLSGERGEGVGGVGSEGKELGSKVDFRGT